MSVSFDVYGPFKVPCEGISAKNGKSKYYQISSKGELENFWKECEKGDEKGCYVFVNGSSPVYVGKTNVSFKKEIFTSHKRVLLNKFLNTASKKKLLVFFVTSKESGRLDEIIGEIEDYLIIQAKRANEDLLNEKNTIPKWSIPGIYGANKIGKPSMAARLLRKSLKL